MIHEKDKCSFLIPSYNDNELLIKTLNSIDGEGIHILIVDDGSNIKVNDYISNCNFTSEITVITFEHNRGIVKALNAGLLFLKKNNYRYVFRIDAGDCNISGRVDKQLNSLIKQELGMIGGHVEYYNSENKFIHYLPLCDIEIRELQHMRSCFIHPSMAIDTNRVKGLYSENFMHAEDYEFFLRLLREQEIKVANLDEVVVKCLVRSDGISLSNRRMQIFSVIKAQLKHFDLRNRYSYLGLLKSFILLVLPYKVTENLKRTHRYLNRKLRG